MKVLLFGANGQVGSEITELFQMSGINIIPLTRQSCCFTRDGDIEKMLIQYQPDMIINAGAYTAVDRAEEEPRLSYEVNSKAVETMASLCHARQIPLIHLSTDYVFDGRQSRPYLENDPVSPLGVYGTTKWQGEQAVRERLKEHIILRVSWVFGRVDHNFVKTILRLAGEKKTLSIVNDQLGCPTPAKDIARVIKEICHQMNQHPHDQWGTYHYVGDGPVTWFGFAQHVIEMARSINHPLMIQELRPITTEEFPTRAKRPAYSVLDTHKIQKVFQIQRHDWRPYLEEVILESSTYLERGVQR